METQEITLHVVLKTSYEDTLGYINYVFEDLEYQEHDYKYYTCIRFPNWNQAKFDIGDEGFVTLKYVREGIDEWFDGSQFIKYKYTNLIFLQFIHLKTETNITNIMVD